MTTTRVGGGPPPRIPTKSGSLVSPELEAAKTRLEAVTRLLENESQRAEQAEQELASLRRAAQAAPTLATNPVVTPETHKPISISPQGLTVRGKSWKFMVPISIILGIGPLIWALVSDYVDTKRELKELRTTFIGVTTRVEAVDLYAHDVAERNHDLRETVAQLSGYLAGILPKAGVKVPGAEPGAISMEIVSDPLPTNEKRQRPVNVHTRVPAPK
jgi:hypothetical protein